MSVPNYKKQKHSNVYCTPYLQERLNKNIEETTVFETKPTRYGRLYVNKLSSREFQGTLSTQSNRINPTQLTSLQQNSTHVNLIQPKSAQLTST